MPIVVIDNFAINKTAPIDSRMVATNSTDRSNIQYKYDGMQVFQTDNRTKYTWNASFSYWETDIAPNLIVGTGTDGYLTTWTGTYSVADTMIYQLQTSTLAGYRVGKVGINTPPSGSLGVKEAFQINAPYSGGEAPPIVIHKGSNSIIGENWYYTTGEQVFYSTKGSSLIEFNNGSLAFKTRSANNPSTTYNKLKVTASDIEISNYEGGTPPNGTVLASIVARSLSYNYNLSGIKFVSDGSWSGGVYPTSMVFYSMETWTQSRAMTIKPNGNVIIGATSGAVSEKLYVDGDVRARGLINFGSHSTPTFGRNGYLLSDDNGIQLNRQTNHPINFATNNINRVSVEATGELYPLYGIKFPSSQYSSSNANTLDDYEEGTITINNFINLYNSVGPLNTLFGTAGGTSNGYLKYVKIGTTVTISGWMTLDWTGVNGGTYGGRTVEFSLPFSPSSSSQGGIGVHLVSPQWTKDTTSVYGGTICIQSISGNPVVLKYHKSGYTSSEPTVNHFKNLSYGVSDIFVTFTYIANQ